jgi:hypothetical protein
MEFDNGSFGRIFKLWLAATLAFLLLLLLVSQEWSPVDMMAASRRQRATTPTGRNSDEVLCFMCLVSVW